MKIKQESEVLQEKYATKSFDDMAEAIYTTVGIENSQDDDTLSYSSVKEHGASRELTAENLNIIPATANGSLIVESGDNSTIEGTEYNDINDIIRAKGGDDLVFGHNGNDRLIGGMGSDHLIGDSISTREDFDNMGQLLKEDFRNDILKGGVGDDILVDQYGSDKLKGGKGNDTLISISDSGIPDENKKIKPNNDNGNDLDKLQFRRRFFNPEAFESNDRLTGGEGSDTFQWNLLINASKLIVDNNTTDGGIINWGMNGVAGENENYHDHWVDGIGRDVITDFSGVGGEKDKIIIKGHTVKAELLFEKDLKAVIGLYSDQGNDGERGGGAHDFDVLGKIVVNHDGNFNFNEDISVIGVDYGAYGAGANVLEVFGFA